MTIPPAVIQEAVRQPQPTHPFGQLQYPTSPEHLLDTQRIYRDAYVGAAPNPAVDDTDECDG